MTPVCISSMKKKGILSGIFIFCFLLLVDHILSLDLNLPGSAELNAANGIGLLVRDPSTAIFNPAVMYPGISSASTNLFSYPELRLHQLSAVKLFNSWGIAVGGKHLEHLSYREIYGVLAVSKQIKQFRIGLDLRYLHNSVKDYYQSGKIIFDAALTWSSGLSVSTILYRNLLQQEILGMRIPTFLIWESCLQISEQVNLGLGLEKQQGEKFIFKLGTLFTAHRNLQLLASCQQQPARLGAGIIVKLSSFKICYGIRTHRYLPYTHSISLTYEIPHP